MSARTGWLVGFTMMLGACRGEARQEREARGDADLARLVDSLRAPVEKAAGLRFTSPPRSGMRSREQVRDYLISKLDEELPPKRLNGLETAYRLFGLLPDTLQLRPLLLDLYTEQVAGFYDPDDSIVRVRGRDGRDGLGPLWEVVLAHEVGRASCRERV